MPPASGQHSELCGLHSQRSSMAEGGTSKPDIIEVQDDDPDNSPDSGLQNPAEVQSYHDRIDHIMDIFSEMLENDQKDALRMTVTSLKKLMVKHWQAMAEADVKAVMKAVHDPGCVFL